MTKTYDYDLFVIGAGSGGVRAARVSAAHGARVAIAVKAKLKKEQFDEVVALHPTMAEELVLMR